MRRAIVTFVTVVTLAACGGDAFTTAELLGPPDGGAGDGPSGTLDVGPDAQVEGGQGTEGGTDAQMADAGPIPGVDAPALLDVAKGDTGGADADGGRVPTEGGGLEGGADAVADVGSLDVVVDAGQGSDGDASDGKECGPSNCAGCCAPTGECVQGDTIAACGKAGRACTTCGWGCSYGTPPPWCTDAGPNVFRSVARPPICMTDGYCTTDSNTAECCGWAADTCDSTQGCH